MLRILGLASILSTAILSTAVSAQEVREPKATDVAERLTAALGGREAWDGTRYVQFDFRVGQPDSLPAGRRHLWDKWEGRYRLEQDRDGKKQVVLFNTNTREGRVFVDGQEVTGEAANETLEKAYGAYINDTYWLAMPWKWLDPGVNLRYVEEAACGEARCDVVQLSFEEVGLTPGDRYLGFVSKESGLMVRWEYTLESGRTGAWDWDYVETGGLQLAKTHVNAEGLHIDMGEVAASDTVDEAMFSDPDKSL